MKIVLLMGSPNRQGSTFLLADAFKRGAEAGGHEVQWIDAAHACLSPCGGCVACGYDGPCAKGDGMEWIGAQILEAGMVALATPLYYFGMSAQLKTVVDRFCALNGRIQRKHMDSALLSVAWNGDSWTFEALQAHYRALAGYLNWRDRGMVLGKGCGTPAMTRGSVYPDQAYRLGKGL